MLVRRIQPPSSYWLGALSLVGRRMGSKAALQDSEEGDHVVRRVDLSKVARPKTTDPHVKVPAPTMAQSPFPLFDPKIHIKSRSERETRLLKDGSTIFCYHPEVKMPFEATRPLRESDHYWKNYRDYITQEEADVLQEMREAEPDKYTTGALARIFQVKPYVVMRVAPTPVARIAKLKEQQQKYKSLRKYHPKKVFAKEQTKAALQNLENAVKDGREILKNRGLLT